MGSARVALPGAVSSSATVPPVPITKVLAGADRLRAPPAVIVQFDNGRGVGGRLLCAVTPGSSPRAGVISESWGTLDVHDGYGGVGDGAVGLT